MGIWVELGIFGLALAFGWWQIRDVKKAMAERKQAKVEFGSHPQKDGTRDIGSDSGT